MSLCRSVRRRSFRRRSDHLKRICAELSVRLVHSRVRMPQGRGKIEKWFGYVNSSFVPEAYLLVERGEIKAVDDLNEFFFAWLEVAYQRKRHSSTKQAPVVRFEKDSHAIRRVDPITVAEAFLWSEERVVDKTGCFSLHGNLYEVEGAIPSSRVTVKYDPYDLSEVRVYSEGRRLSDAVPLELSRRMHKSLGASAPAEVKLPSSGLSYLSLLKKEKEKLDRLSYSSIYRREKKNDS